MVTNIINPRGWPFASKLSACALSLVALLQGLSAPAQALSGQSAVELPRYLGTWYEYARTPNQFQDNMLLRDGKEYGPCFAARTMYRADGDDAIRLRNACERRAADGSSITESITGKAVLRSGTQGRKLRIAFGSGLSRFFQRAISGGGFAYWIYCIGPVNGSGLYDWAVVSGPDKDYLFVLTRKRVVSDQVRAAIIRCSTNHGLPTAKLIYRQGNPVR